jgi:hypothetical protein
MAIRRQGYEFDFVDLGNLPSKRLAELSERRQSVLVGADINDGFGVLTKSLYTEADEYIVLDYIGSTPGGFQRDELKGSNWGPRGFVNVILDDTAYYQTLDGRDYDGMSGIGAPYPISRSYQPAYRTKIPIEIPPGRWWDIRYIAYNRILDIPDAFTGTCSSFSPVVVNP